jgi:hypothetical protein
MENQPWEEKPLKEEPAQEVPAEQRPMEENLPGENPKPKYVEPRSSKTIFIGLVAAILIILAIVIIGFFSEQDDDDDEQNTATEEQVETTGTESMEPIPIGEEGLTVYGGISPSTWDRLEKATTNIQTLGEGQDINYYVVQDPTDENAVYFASSAYSFEDKENLVSIYKYFLDSNNFERLFRNTYQAGTFPNLSGDDSVPTLRVIGYDNGRLIVLAHYVDDSPGPCANPLLMGAGSTGVTRNLLSMNISDPYAGFEEYTASQEALDQAEAEAVACQENL